MIFSSDQFINGMSWVIAYFFLRSLACIISILFFTNFIFKTLGFGKSIILSLLILIAEIVLWIWSESNLYLMLPAGVMAGVIVTTYWIPYHLFFIEKLRGASDHFGQSTATRSFLSNLASAIAPAAGGLIISLFGFRTLFLVSMFLLIISGLPTLLIVQDWKHHHHYPFKIVKEIMFNAKYKLLSLAYFGEGLDFGTYSILWPIVLFLFLSGFTEIGFLNATSLITAAISTIIVGKLIDKKGYKIIHFIGSFTNAILYIPRIFFTTPNWLYSIDIVDRLNSPFFGLPNLSITYEKAQKFERSDFMIYRELVIHSGIIFAMLACFFLLPVLSNWKILFLIAAIGTALNYLLDLDKN